MAYSTKEKQKKALHSYYLKNKDYFKKHSYEWKKRNPEKVKLSRKKYNDKNSKNLSNWFSLYKNNAKRRKISFKLTKDEFKNLVRLNCFYCGEQASPINGIDRLNNKLGYSIENCVTSCKWCNIMKFVYSKQEFIEKCIKIVNHTKGTPTFE